MHTLLDSFVHKNNRSPPMVICSQAHYSRSTECLHSQCSGIDHLLDPTLSSRSRTAVFTKALL